MALKCLKATTNIELEHDQQTIKFRLDLVATIPTKPYLPESAVPQDRTPSVYFPWH